MGITEKNTSSKYGVS